MDDVDVEFAERDAVSVSRSLELHRAVGGRCVGSWRPDDVHACYRTPLSRTGVANTVASSTKR